MADGDSLRLGRADNTATKSTGLRREGRAPADALSVSNANGPGITASVSSSATAVAGESPTGAGVAGSTEDGIGVVGRAASPKPASAVGAGVWGVAEAGLGVVGTSSSGAGVQGLSESGIGVVGQAVTASGVVGSSQTGPGLSGVSQASVGVEGSSASGPGLAGESRFNAGVAGTSDASAGVSGQSAEGIGVHGSSTRGLAGHFEGPVVVSGDLTVTGSTSIAARHPDGSHRRLYSLGSPQGWFEDFGEASLRGGKAVVKLDPDFAALVDTARYYVFLTSYGPGHLYVERQEPGGFEVRVAPGVNMATTGPRAEGPARFAYRVVAKRRDAPGRRLEKVVESPFPSASSAPEADALARERAQQLLTRFAPPQSPGAPKRRARRR
jgi:hypothetical protein